MKENKKENINKDTNEVVKKLLYENETKSNYLIANACILFASVILLFCILECAGVFGDDGFDINHIPVYIISIIICIINAVITYTFKGELTWIKYLNLFSFSICIAAFNLVFSYNVVIMIALPVILSSRYFSQRIVCGVSIIFGLMWIASTYIGEYFNLTWVDLNYYEPPAGAIINIGNKYLYDAVLECGMNLPIRIEYASIRLFIQMAFYVVLSIICISLAKTGYKLIYQMAEEQMDKARISTELNIASKIQASILPNANPALPDHNEFTLYATMTPAKEVGGDFYDFYMVDDDNIAIVMADVSGKGVPAALFMVIAKTIIKNVALNSKSKSTAYILKTANQQICEGNDESYFVTVWMGIINIRTGKGIVTNAGHENPAIKKSNGLFELLNYKHSPALGLFPDMQFEEHTFEMNKGDTIFVYTDGVPEATSIDKSLFGNDRLLSALNKDKNANIDTILKNVKLATEEFTIGAEQFDDITMLGYHFNS